MKNVYVELNVDECKPLPPVPRSHGGGRGPRIRRGPPCGRFGSTGIPFMYGPD
jgi:hypothetical protein